MVIPVVNTTDIQFINVAGQGDMHYMADFPYGLALLTAYMREQGLRTLLLQYPTWLKDEYIGPILDSPAHVYGFQVNFENYPDIIELIQIIKEHHPNAKFVYGGPFVVSLYEEILKNDRYVDAVVLGEGEYTSVELVNSLKADDPDWKSINGLAWVDDNGEIVVNDHRNSIPNMDAMPFASRDGVKDGVYDIEGKYLHDIRITTSRGCTSNCTFCAVNLSSTWQRAKRWRSRSAENVVDEIEDLVNKYNVKLINLQDSAFDEPGRFYAKRTREFCEEILKRNLEISMKAYFRAHAVKFDEESIDLYKLYKEAGIDVIICGFEAGSDFELDLYRKDATLEDNYRCYKTLNDMDLFFVHNGFIMYGPYSNEHTLRSNVKFLGDNGLCAVYDNISSALILTPGAAIYDTMLEEGRILPRENFWETPSYLFDNELTLQLAQHYQILMEVYPHLKEGNFLVREVQNTISRLKNKMNKKIAIACSDEFEEFKNVFARRRNELNQLGSLGFVENLDRAIKDGWKADLINSSDPYFGHDWEVALDAIRASHDHLIKTIESKGFGLGGVVFVPEATQREQRTDDLVEMAFVDKGESFH